MQMSVTDNSPAITKDSSEGVSSIYCTEGQIYEKVKFKPGMKDWMSGGWWQWCESILGVDIYKVVTGELGGTSTGCGLKRYR